MHLNDPQSDVVTHRASHQGTLKMIPASTLCKGPFNHLWEALGWGSTVAFYPLQPRRSFYFGQEHSQPEWALKSCCTCLNFFFFYSKTKETRVDCFLQGLQKMLCVKENTQSFEPQIHEFLYMCPLPWPLESHTRGQSPKAEVTPSFHLARSSLRVFQQVQKYNVICYPAAGRQAFTQETGL